MITETFQQALALSRLIMRFGQVFRVTEDPQGRFESDTTHSMMLALLAGEFSQRESVPLDRSVVVALALVHDLAEVYAGDTSTIRALSASQHAAKQQAEADALQRIRQELQGLPWVLELIARYEAQACPESRYVRYLDKVLPKLTHVDNGCAPPRKVGMDVEELWCVHTAQQIQLDAKYPEFTGVRELLRFASAKSEQAMRDATAHEQAKAQGDTVCQES